MIPRRGRQRGIALIALLAVILLAASWMFLSRLNMSAAELMVQRRAHNAQVLSQAKQAVIGYMAQLASETGENNPGRLLCPEPTSAPGTSNEGIAAGNCSQPAIGRLPWKTLGLDKLVDSSGEPLWYVVSPGWALPSSSTYMTINSNTIGALSVDGNANSAIALIIAPGPAINAQAATGCTARDQLLTRAAPAPGINPLDYLECFNSSTYTYSTTGSSTSFNDQVAAVTVADLMPALEAAISARINRDVVPVLKSLYASVPAWNLTSTTPVFPFATSFGDPSVSTYAGSVGTREGLLPMSRMNACTGSTTVGCPPVNATLTAWGSPSATRLSGAFLSSSSCSLVPVAAPTSISCSLNTFSFFGGSITVRVQATINPFLALRTVDNTVASNAPGLAGAGSTGFSPSCTGSWASLSSSGATIQCSGSVAVASGSQTYTVTVPIPIADGMTTGTLLTDSSLTDPSTAQTGWFVRNQWYQLTFYAADADNLAGGTAPCSTNCLTVTNASPSTGNRSLLIVMGRTLTGQNRSGAGASSLSNYIENAENSNGNTTYVLGTPSLSLNDRFVIVDHN